MKIKKVFRHLPLILAGFAMSAGVFVNASSLKENKAEETKAYYTPSTHYEVSDTASELNSYYSSISSGDTGTTLLSKLQSLNSTKRKKTMGYSTMGTSISSSPYSYTDYDLNNTAVDSNGQIYGTKVASFYTKTSATDWNREHVWPNSRGGSSVEGDILHTRPTISSENSSRGNSMYVEGKNSSSAGWDPYTAGYDAACRGECARIILYSVVASTSLSLVAADNDDTSNKTMGNMNTLIKWHFDYSPSVYEINRNNGAEYLQGNRNPFVDHPEYVARIWSSFNSTISTLCNNNASMYENWVPGSASTYGTNDAVDATGVSISKTSVSLTVDNSTTISATSSNSSTITWSTSNNSVASISSTSAASGSNITITAVSVGSATITAKATISGVQYTKTCTVTVTASGGSSGGNGEYSVYSGAISEGNYLITYDNKAMKNTVSSNRLDYTTVSPSNNKITSPDASIIWHIAQSGSYWTIYNASVSKYAAGTGTKNQGVLIASVTDNAKWTVSGSSTYEFVNLGNSNSSVNANLRENTTYGFACYSTSTGGALTLYKEGESSSSTKTLSSISVSTAPTKTTYTAGEYFDPTGLVITRTYSDSSSDTYAYAGHTSEFTFSPTTSTALATSNTSVTISYGGKSCSQAITVTAALSSISISGYTTSFVEGDTFSFGGTVTANYSGGGQSNVTSQATFSGYNMTTLGSQTVTVSYGGKSKTYTITVGQGTLSSIAVSGQTTSYVKNTSFSFDGICTATMENGYQKTVTPTSVSSPDMSTVGSKTITVSLTYNNKTKSTTYSITVNPNRVVLETSTTSKSETITWPSSATPVIDGTLTNVTATATGKTQYEASSLRLGTGSGGGTLTISATEKITSLDISAKYYSDSYSSSVLKVDGQSVTPLSSNYSTYSVILSSGKTSFTVLTQNSSSRVNIQTITLYSVVTTETDISSTSDCVGLESFIDTYMHMDYTQNLGYCKDNTHHYYSTAKSAFNNLNTHQRSLFTSNSAYSDEWARLSAWASANGESLNSSNILGQNNNYQVGRIISENNNAITLIIIISLLGATSIGICFYLRKKREN